MSEDVIDLLTELVAISSVNPSLIPGAPGETEAARCVSDWARASGLVAETVESTSGRPSVIVRSGRGNGPSLLLCGHLDTVGTDRVDRPFSPRIDGDRLYGRGAYDMKGGFAAALVAAKNAKDVNGEVIVAAVADEEHASIGVQEILRHVHADAAIVTEPTELRVATAHKGFVWTELVIIGRAAHGSRPHLGIDAITKSERILGAFRQLNSQLGERPPHPLLGNGNVHASLIAGGREESTIPERCVITMERRTLPGERVADIEQEITTLLQDCRIADADLTVTARTILSREPFQTDADAPIVRAVANLVEGDPSPVGVSYWADSAFISGAGIPTVLFGPDGDGAHAAVEWVSLSGTVACARVLTSVAMAFCR